MSLPDVHLAEAHLEDAEPIDETARIAAALKRLAVHPRRCYRCGEAFRSASRAVSASCTKCYRQVVVQDVVVRGTHWGTPILSCGTVTIAKRAKARCQLVIASEGVRVQGLLEALVVSGGRVEVESGGELRGGILAPAVRFHERAVLDIEHSRVPIDPLGLIDPEELSKKASRGLDLPDLAALISGG